MKSFGNFRESNHLYQIGTTSEKILVFANTRLQARKIAEREGFEVRDINMVG